MEFEGKNLLTRFDKQGDQSHNFCSDGRWRASLRLDQHYNCATIFTLVPLRTRIVTPMPGRVKSPVISLRISVSTEKKPRCFLGLASQIRCCFGRGSFSQLAPRCWVSRSRCWSPGVLWTEELSDLGLKQIGERDRFTQQVFDHDWVSHTQNILPMFYSPK